MANFKVTITFLEVKHNPVPVGEELLFFNAEKKHLAQGWMSEDNTLVLIGAQWEPTHFAHFNEALLAMYFFEEAVAACPLCTEETLCSTHAQERGPGHLDR